MNLLIDPVNVGTNTGVHRIPVSRARFVSHPRGRSTKDPPATLHTRQGPSTVSHTHTASFATNTDHGAFIYGLSVSLSTHFVVHYRNRGLFQLRSKYGGIWVDPSPAWLQRKTLCKRMVNFKLLNRILSDAMINMTLQRKKMRNTERNPSRLPPSPRPEHRAGALSAELQKIMKIRRPFY